ncbi:MAG: hypothetical protein HW384_970 [Dehalococcoidia bacterium]|nr:hypothetical protein [Dehalococcoidia bacterium]
MKKSKSSISQVKSYEEIGAFWDTHDLGDHWGKTRPVDFEINITSEETYCPLDNRLLLEVGKAARQQGISPRKLMESWIKEKLAKTKV